MKSAILLNTIVILLLCSGEHRTASTYAELATLLRMWDGCVRWQDIKQKKASVRGADKALEVLGKKVKKIFCFKNIKIPVDWSWLVDITNIFVCMETD